MSATARADPRAPIREQLPLLVVGIVLFIGSELMFFGSLFGMYFTLRAQSSPWTPPEVKIDPSRLLFTSILLASSFTMQYAVRQVKRGNVASMRRWIWVTLLMGVVFLSLVLAQSRTGQLSMARHDPVEAGAIYWHFVDVVWIGLFTIFYLMAR